MGSSGSPSAHVALAGLLTAKGIEPKLRLRALTGLARTPVPSEAAVEALTGELSRNPFSTGALYGLGSYSLYFRDNGDREREASIGALLLERLDHADDVVPRLIVTLGGITNSGYAVQAREPSDVLAEALTNVARRSDNPNARYKSVDLLARWGKARPALRAVIQQVASNDPEERVRALWACTIPWSSYGSGGGESGVNLVFGHDQALQESLRELAGSELTPDAGAPNTLSLSYSEEAFCGYCYAHAWSCSSSSLVTSRADACFNHELSRSGKVDPNMCLRRSAADSALCDEWTRCFDDACERANTANDGQRSLWPAVVDEITAAEARCAACGVQREERCQILAVDPCAGRVGYVCRQAGSGKPEFRELALTEAP